MKNKHEALLDFYDRSFDRVDSVFDFCTRDGTLGCKVGCSQLCEPHNFTRSVWLMPYERFAIRKKTGRKVPAGYMLAGCGTQCMFNENNRCALGRYKPIACRMFPAFFYCAAPGFLDAYIYGRCPAISRVSGNAMSAHMDTWLAHMVEISPHLAWSWWKHLAEVVSGQHLQHLHRIEFSTGGTLLGADATIPVGLCEQFHNPTCSYECDMGVLIIDNEQTACCCVRSAMGALELKID